MNNFLRWGVLATALMALIGGSVGAQTPGQSIPATKVGTVNMGTLFTKYEKAKIYKTEIEAEIAPLKAEAEKINNVMKGHKDWLAKGHAKTDPVQGEKSEKAVRDCMRALEDLDAQARTKIGKKQETQVVQLYKEVHSAVQIYAQQNGFHMILAYGDPADEDPYTLRSINRRMGGMDIGAMVPYYTATGLDITNDVLARLNGNLSRVAPPAPGVTPIGFTPKQ